jgi:hypothetical protein
MKKLDVGRPDAIEHILEIGTGKLLSLERYRKSLPEGKRTKGIFEQRGRKRPAEKAKKLTPYVTAETPATSKPAKRKAKAEKPAKRKAKPKAADYPVDPRQLVIAPLAMRALRHAVERRAAEADA